jgi:hypothetical protein
MGAEHGQHVGQVVLALDVVGGDLPQGDEQRIPSKAKDRGVDLPEVEFELGRVARDLRLDDALDGAVGRPDDPTVAGGRWAEAARTASPVPIGRSCTATSTSSSSAAASRR